MSAPGPMARALGALADYNPTVSAFYRADACPASHVLGPRVDFTTADGDDGTILHAYTRAVVVGVPVADALRVVPKRLHERCQAIEYHRIIADLRDVHGEVAHRYHVETGDAVELGHNLGRKYPPKTNDKQIDGSIDLIGVSVLHEQPVVADVKTGRKHLGPVKDNLQIGIHALCRARILGASGCEGRIAYVDDDGKVRVDSHMFTAFDLDMVSDRIADILERVHKTAIQYAETGRIDVRKGDWCQYCAAIQSCPAKTGLVREMLPTLTAMRDQVQGQLVTLRRKDIGQIWVKLDEIKHLTEIVEEALKSTIKTVGPCPTRDDKVVKAAPRSRSKIDSDALERVLTALGASEEQRKSIYSKTHYEQVSEVKARRGDVPDDESEAA